MRKEIIIAIIVMAFGAFGTIFWYTFTTVIENKSNSEGVKKELHIINDKFDVFITLHRSQNKELNKRINSIKDTLSVQDARNTIDHNNIATKLNKVIYIDKKTNKNFNAIWNTINLAYEQKN